MQISLPLSSNLRHHGRAALRGAILAGRARRAREPGAKPERLGPVDRARYQARHRALALTLGAYMGFWHRVVLSGGRPDDSALRDLRRSFDDLLAADLANVEAGHYPRALLHDVPYGAYLRVVPEALRDQPRVLRRALARRHDDLPHAARPESYPPYYRRNFHWQTDGWLSERSARLYDLSVELLFGGTADIMRRMALPPLLAELRGLPAPRVLDIACGTGHFLAAIHRALPAARLSGIDLSPFYVAHARQQLAGLPVSLAAENAEATPFAGASFDAASAVFLLHELPADVRRRVVREAWRVLRPGARLVICDAAQHRDSGERRFFLDSFPALYHEPYFKSYLRDDLEPLLTACGFQVESSTVHFLAKVVVARRVEDRASGFPGETTGEIRCTLRRNVTDAPSPVRRPGRGAGQDPFP